MNAMTPFVSDQRDRAAQEAMAGLIKFSSGVLRETARENFRASDEGKALADAWKQPDADSKMEELVGRAVKLAESDPTYRMERFCQRIVAEEGMNRGISFKEARRAQIEAMMAAPKNSPGGTLELDPSLPIPKYYDGVEFHLMPGGWDGDELYSMPGAGPQVNVYKYGGFAAVPFNSNIYKHRVAVAEQLYKDKYDKIYEIGCGPANTLPFLHQVYPDAELIACDLSHSVLKAGHDRMEKMGIKATLKQRDAAATGEDENSMDAVVSFAIHHECPYEDNIEILTEIFRILKPGGDLVISDPPPFRAVEPFHAAVLDWDTVGRLEPYFSEACLSNWDEELKKIGFTNVESYALGADSYPWITRASKPL